MNLVYKAARDFITPEVDHVYIDDLEEYEKVRDFMRLLGFASQYLDRIEHYNSGCSLFKDFKVDEEIQKLLRPKVNLPSGGSIVIETTEALTVIDINSGKFTGGRNLEDTIVKTNIEAAAEIARQVRLRDIGGIIVCDFIDMNSESSRNKVLSTLETGLRKDRTRTTIQSFSALGLLEFTRKRVGKDLAGQLRSGCPTCHGAGTVMSPESVTIETFRKIRIDSNGKHEHVCVETHPYVGAQMEYWYEDELKSLSETIGAPIEIHVDPATPPEHPHVYYGVSKNGKAERPVVRVGDEFEVELANMRLPNPTSALAVVAGRLVEVENAAGAVGQTMKIKIIDIDDDEILAEPRTPVAGARDAAPSSRRTRTSEAALDRGTDRRACGARRRGRRRRRCAHRDRHLDRSRGRGRRGDDEVADASDGRRSFGRRRTTILQRERQRVRRRPRVASPPPPPSSPPWRPRRPGRTGRRCGRVGDLGAKRRGTD